MFGFALGFGWSACMCAQLRNWRAPSQGPPQAPRHIASCTVPKLPVCLPCGCELIMRVCVRQGAGAHAPRSAPGRAAAAAGRAAPHARQRVARLPRGRRYGCRARCRCAFRRRPGPGESWPDLCLRFFISISGTAAHHGRLRTAPLLQERCRNRCARHWLASACKPFSLFEESGTSCAPSTGNLFVRAHTWAAARSNGLPLSGEAWISLPPFWHVTIVLHAGTVIHPLARAPIGGAGCELPAALRHAGGPAFLHKSLWPEEGALCKEPGMGYRRGLAPDAAWQYALREGDLHPAIRALGGGNVSGRTSQEDIGKHVV